jgi:O-antigen/teichoic acid export membrane protein
MIIGNIMAFRTIVAVLMIGIAAAVAFFIPQYQGTHIPLAILIAGASSILNLLASTVCSVQQVYLKMQYSAFATIMEKVVNIGYLLLVIYVLYPGNSSGGFYQLAWAGVAGDAAMFGINYYYSRKLTPIHYRIDRQFWSEVLISALPYGIALILNTVYFRIGSVLLSLMRTKAEVGIYGLPLRILDNIGVLPAYLMNAVLPTLTRSLHRKDSSHQRIIQLSFDFLVMGSMPIVGGTIALATPLVLLMSEPQYLSDFSKGFYGSDIVLSILIVATAFSFVNMLFGYIIVADNRQNELLARNAGGAVLTIILDLLLIPYFGVRGAAVNNVIAECYVAVASYLIAKKYVKFTIKLGNALKALLAGVVMSCTVYLLRGPTYNLFHLHNANIIVLIPLGGVIYIGMLFVTGAISKEIIDMIKKPPTKNAVELAAATEEATDRL